MSLLLELGRERLANHCEANLIFTGVPWLPGLQTFRPCLKKRKKRKKEKREGERKGRKGERRKKRKEGEEIPSQNQRVV